MLAVEIKHYFYLMRLHKPIGIFLLLWPTLWALWLASNGKPTLSILSIFILGVILMRSAGCVINDWADRHFDGHVLRTKNRPLATQKISANSALILFGVLSLISFGLVLKLNGLSILLAIMGMLITILYPFLKRFTHLPQLGLGVAFAWGVPMAFAAERNELISSTWLVFLAAVIWPIIYDTMYALADRDCDIKIGVKSTAILFGDYTVYFIGVLQILFILVMIKVGLAFQLKWPFFFSLNLVALLFLYQYYLIKNYNPSLCFKAFLNNHWVGLFIFLGIISK